MRKLANILEPLALVAAPCALLLCAFLGIEQSALATLAIALVAIGIIFAGFESSKPKLKEVMPSAVLGALAAAGRILFAPFPDFKPVTAICIIAGVVFGRRSGFMVGALAALISNMFFGQGPWTPWQMYSWGLVGYLAGALANCGVFGPVGNLGDAGTQKARVGSKPSILLLAFGFASCLLYGFILNSWYVVGFLNPITIPGALAVYTAGLPFDLIHGVATVVILAALYLPWERKLRRIALKYDLRQR